MGKIFAGVILVMLWSGAVAGQTLGKCEVIRYDQLAAMIAAPSDTTFVFNFMATWCDPCVKEFPAFQKLSAEYASRKVRFVFVSLDFKRSYQKSLLPFLKRHKVTNDVYLLDEPDYNAWIDRVDSGWDGNLPATLVINNSHHIRQMYAHDFTYESLKATLNPFVF